jgi:pyruvate formate lyase activating enzyme
VEPTKFIKSEIWVAQTCGCADSGFLVSDITRSKTNSYELSVGDDQVKEAYLYKRSEWGEVKCILCRHLCRIDDGKRGICRVRRNRNGILYTELYDKAIVACPGSIELAPLFHVCPGSRSFFLAALGLNFFRAAAHRFSTWGLCRDAFPIVELDVSPASIVDLALRGGCKSIAYAHTEPTIFYELARDTMEEARKAGLLNVFVTNGYMTREMLEDAKGLIDAANVDLWAFNDSFYDEYFEAGLEGVKDSLCHMKHQGIWLEVTTTLIPKLNDDPAEIREMVRFIRKELGPETPWHIGRYIPHHTELGMLPTDVEALHRARQVALDEGLHHVYMRNMPEKEAQATLCPGCCSTLIEREGGKVTVYGLKEGFCPDCGYPLAGLEMQAGHTEA